MLDEALVPVRAETMRNPQGEPTTQEQAPFAVASKFRPGKRFSTNNV